MLCALLLILSPLNFDSKLPLLREYSNIQDSGTAAAIYSGLNVSSNFNIRNMEMTMIYHIQGHVFKSLHDQTYVVF